MFILNVFIPSSSINKAKSLEESILVSELRDNGLSNWLNDVSLVTSLIGACQIVPGKHFQTKHVKSIQVRYVLQQ